MKYLMVTVIGALLMQSEAGAQTDDTRARISAARAGAAAIAQGEAHVAPLPENHHE